jgi:hypothetical protein
MSASKPQRKLTKNVNFRVTEELWERVGVVARRVRMSILALLTTATERYLDELEAELAAGAAQKTTEAPASPASSSPSTEKVLESFLTKPKQQK